MDDAGQQPFRFLDLPGELRNKVYTLLLSARDAVTDTKVGPLELCRTKHNIEPTILRTSRQVHREAYEVMVKSSRFVCIESVSPLPLRSMVSAQHVPVVARDAGRISQFHGCVMKLTLRTRYPVTSVGGEYIMAPTSLMIRGNDLESFCQGIMCAGTHCPDFSDAIVIDVHLAPVLEYAASGDRDSWAEFFSESTQEGLLAPLRKLHNMDRLSITGHVSKELANSVILDARADEWGSEPKKVVDKLLADKAEANQAYNSAHHERAAGMWANVGLKINRLWRSSSCDFLVSRGGQAFVDKLAETLFLVVLNAANALTQLYGPIATDVRVPQELRETRQTMVEYLLSAAQASVQPDYWNEGTTWAPSDVQLAKLHYRLATYNLFWGGPSNLAAVTHHIKKALEYAPNDRNILAMQEQINK